ncbi:hypothetical protein [Paraburkholderia sp. BCC1876]|uniref:hypothetical protein n=1 Tax=Paraburkholderia sp. BCC1876 TaxID=2676303 RepID=UPI001591926F|nr:hypothetical protein [Paraburkholderia sp. BCC1876]
MTGATKAVDALPPFIFAASPSTDNAKIQIEPKTGRLLMYQGTARKPNSFGDMAFSPLALWNDQS